MDTGPSDDQLIDANGSLNVNGLKKFVKETKFDECGVRYAVVSVMGPQSSGKSTLFNHLFGTNFKEMNASEGRSQTTQGVWIAKAVFINEKYTLVMDLEGSDGRERGENGKTFEKQIALLALAVSDIVLINMWCTDIGREDAANKPLMRTVFQEMLRLVKGRKITLMFVIRDTDPDTPKEKLEHTLMEDLQQIWGDISKPEQVEDVPYSEYFNVEVFTLPHYKYKIKEFENEVVYLRQRICHNSVAPGRATPGDLYALPASAFCINVEGIWTQIKDNKDLDLPTRRVSVATVRCDQILDEKCKTFKKDQEWCHLMEMMKYKVDPNFRKRVSSLIHKYIESYIEEARYLDEGIRSAKQKLLEEKLLQLIYPTFKLAVQHIRSKTLEDFKKNIDQSLAIKGDAGFSSAASESSVLYINKFAQGCQDIVIEQANWDISEAENYLCREIEIHIDKVRDDRARATTEEHEVNLTTTLSEFVESLLGEATDEKWPKITELLQKETESAVSSITDALSGLGVNEQTKQAAITKLRGHARCELDKTEKQEATYRIPTATVRCDQIAEETYTAFKTNQEWRQIKEDTKVKLIPDFRRRVRSLMDTYIQIYERKARYFDESVRSAKQKQLEEKLLQLIHPTCELAISHIKSMMLTKSKKEFDQSLLNGELFTSAASKCASVCMDDFNKRCQDVVFEQANWDTSKLNLQLKLDLDAHIDKVRDDHTRATTEEHEVNLTTTLSEYVQSLLGEAADEKWPKITGFLQRKTELAVSSITATLSGLGVNAKAKETAINNLRVHARSELAKTKKQEDNQRIPMATVRCEQIMEKMYNTFKTHPEWIKITEDMKVDLKPDFKRRVSSLMDTCIQRYKNDAQYFDADVRNAKQKQLEEKLLQLIRPTVESALWQIKLERLTNFKEVFDQSIKMGYGFSSAASKCSNEYMSEFRKRCQDFSFEKANWDTSKMQLQLKVDLDAHINTVRDRQVRAMTEKYEERWADNLSGHVQSLLHEGTDETWPNIRELLRRETESAVPSITAELSDLGVHEPAKKNKVIKKIQDRAKSEVEKTAKREAKNVQAIMANCALMSLFGTASAPNNEDVKVSEAGSRAKALKLLSVMAAIRLDNNETDNIEDTLFAAFFDSSNKTPLPSRDVWEGVPQEKTLIKPNQCRSLWNFTEKLFNKIREEPEKIKKRWYENAALTFIELLKLIGIDVAEMIGENVKEWLNRVRQRA